MTVLRTLVTAIAGSGFAVLCLPGTVAAVAQTITVEVATIDDRKAVFGTVESVDTIAARARIGGTLTDVTVDEGSMVTAGAELARIVDDKLDAQTAAIRARVEALRAQLLQAETELARAERLLASGTAPQSRVDDARTGVDVLVAEIAAAQADERVILEQQAEGAILAPTSGRVLTVHAVDGTVVMPGEPVATIAAETFVLRLYLPERHARFLAIGDTVQVGAGQLVDDRATLREGAVRQVYPRLEQGRVVADVEVAGLGDFFVGERVRVYVSTGYRQAVVIPRDYVFARFGIDYVRLESGIDVAVRVGAAAALPDQPDAVEILSGLRSGDRIVPPAAGLP